MSINVVLYCCLYVNIIDMEIHCEFKYGRQHWHSTHVPWRLFLAQPGGQDLNVCVQYMYMGSIWNNGHRSL